MNPETASLPDLNDSLPLHLAVYFNSSLEVVQAVYNGRCWQYSIVVTYSTPQQKTHLSSRYSLPHLCYPQCTPPRRW